MEDQTTSNPISLWETNLSRQLVLLQERYRNLREAVAEENRALSQSQQERLLVQKETSGVRAELQDLRTDYARSQRQKDRALEELREVHVELERKRNNLAVQEQELAEVRERLRSARLQQLEKEFLETRNVELSKLAAKWYEGIQELQRRYDLLLARIVDLDLQRRERDQVVAERQETAAELDMLLEQLDEVKEILKANRTTCQQLEEQKDALSNILMKSKSDIAQLSSIHADINTQVESLRSERNNLSRSISHLDLKVQMLTAEIEEKRKPLEKLQIYEKQRTQLQHTLNILDEQFEVRQLETKKLETELTNKQDERDNLELMLRSLRHQVAELENRMADQTTSRKESPISNDSIYAKRRFLLELLLFRVHKLQVEEWQEILKGETTSLEKEHARLTREVKLLREDASMPPLQINVKTSTDWQEKIQMLEAANKRQEAIISQYLHENKMLRSENERLQEIEENSRERPVDWL